MPIVAVGREIDEGESRVAVVPEGVKRLAKDGIEVRVERGAGEAAAISDQQYVDAGATIADAPALLDGADLLVRVRRPAANRLAELPDGLPVLALFQPGSDPEYDAALERSSVQGLALERVPRITRAQSMDVLSSQATVAGYMAVLIGATAITKFLPMLTTAAGAIPPARVFVIGAGVAGLQAIATAKRLGAQVSGFDIRAAAAEQVRSLGATFVEGEAGPADGEAAGGYARAQTDDEQARTLETIGRHIRDMDLVVTTAQIPGRRAPELITREMVASMKPGSAIVDLAAETGGNCAATAWGETVTEAGVKVLGPRNLPAMLPLHASQMFSRNVVTLLQHMLDDGVLKVDADDEIIGPMMLRQRSTVS